MYTTVNTDVNHRKNYISFPSIIFHPIRLMIKDFKPKIRIFIERQRFIVKTAENAFELEKALKLRYEVFYKEMLNKRHFLFIDVDKFDMSCDHLMIIDKTSGDLVGTYRFNSSLFAKTFYSELEFDMSSIKNLSGVKVELGRVCIRREWRTSATLALFWKGIADYLAATDAKYLFGCSSIHTTDYSEINLVTNYLKKNHYSDASLRVTPKPFFEASKKSLFDIDMSSSETLERAKALIPSLLYWYLKIGAVICGEPAIDRAFRCTDYFTILDMDRINKRIESRFTAK
ncbi:MAG: GNAT family N-acetyltransferase [Elusimicrobia bacterium]|nr:GNAT family N-acetyltransferase [Elusimicrobiota bacterium]